jgi:hypothetical protein
VNFDRLHQLLPDFRFEFNLASGLEHLHKSLLRIGFDRAAFEGDRFVRLRTLRKRLDTLQKKRSGRSAAQ